MTDRPWPLAADERPGSLAALVAAEVPDLRHWLRMSILSWSSAASDGERVTAFSPLVLERIEPARQIDRWYRALPTDARLRIEAALNETVQTWDPSLDATATILLARLAGHIGGNGLARSLIVMLGKPVAGTPENRLDLAEAIAYFADRRASSAEARQLAYRLRDAGLLFPTAGFTLLACVAKELDAGVLDDLDIIAPEVVSTDPDDDPAAVAALRRYCANGLVDTLGAPAAMRLALLAQEQGVPELREAINRFRLDEKQEGSVFILHDRLLSRSYREDMSDIQGIVRETRGSIAVHDKLSAQTSIDRFLSRGAEG